MPGSFDMVGHLFCGGQPLTEWDSSGSQITPRSDHTYYGGGNAWVGLLNTTRTRVTGW